VSRAEKTLDRILRGNADASLRFVDVCSLLRRLGFAERIRGDHHIFTRDGIPEIVNLQPRDGKAKPYQVKQIRDLIGRHGLADQPDPTTREDDDGE
jgi:hypothetical protein